MVWRHDSPAVPAWCSWFSPDDWVAFRALVESTVRDERGDPLRVGQGPTVTQYAADGTPDQLDLTGLAVRLRDVPRHGWREALAAWFRQRAEMADEWQAIRTGGPDRVRHLLFPRIVATGAAREDAVLRPLGGGLAAALCVRAGNGGGYPLEHSTLRSWDVDSAELWALALHNLRRDAVTPREMVPGPNPLRALEGPAWHTAAHLLRLDDLIGAPTPYGVLTILPCDSWLLYWVIRGPEVLTAGMSMQRTARSLWEQVRNSPARLSPYLLWWHENVLETVEFIISETPGSPDTPHQIRTPTTRFTTMLREMVP
jgi:hypothetical protein